MKHPCKGFSLTELLVVIAVLLIVLSIIVVSAQHTHAQALQLQCRHRLEQLGQAMEMYSTKHQGMLPRSWDSATGMLWFETLASTYLDDADILTCPVVGEPPIIGQRGGGGDSSRDYVETYSKVLNWLKYKQDDDGRWPVLDADAGWWRFPNTMTGFALMALFGYGCNDRHPPEFAETVQKAVEYISGPLCQIKSGENAGRLTGTVSGYTDNSAYMYAQGVNLMALAAAVRVVEDPELREKARQAAILGMQWVGRQQPSHGAFNYSGGAYTGKADSSGTGWAYQGVGSCRLAGIPIPSGIMEKAQGVLDHMAASNGQYGYRWYPPPEGTGTSDWLSHRHTSIGLMVRLLLGESAQSPVVQSQISYITTPENGIPRHIYRFTNPAGAYQCPGDGKDRYQYYHTTRGLRKIGGQNWETWRYGNPSIIAHGVPFEGFPKYVIKHLVEEGMDDEGNPLAYWPKNCASAGQGMGPQCGTVYATALSLCMLSYAYEEHWNDEEYTPPTEGECSYGYNNRLGYDRRQPDGNTIVIMDYMHWEIDHDEVVPNKNDGPDKIAGRHSGQANALMGDGRVESLRPENVREGMWTPEPGD